MAEYTGKTYTKEDYEKLNTATGQEFGKAGEAAVQGQAQEWRDQGNPMPGTNKPEDIRSLGSQLFDWAKTPAGNAVLGGLGLAGIAAATGLGIKDRMKRPEAAPRVEPYVAPTYDFETTAREVPDRAGLPQPSTPAPQAAAPTPTTPAPAPTGVPTPAPQVAMPGEPQPQMKYGETKYNVPTASPEVPVAPPAEVAPAPVAPKPIDPVQQARLDAIAADQRRKDEAHAASERRKDEAHANRLAADAKRNAETVQKSQGKASTSLSNNANALVANVAEGKIKADLIESTGTKPVNNLPIGGTGTPVPNVATPPAGSPPPKPIAPTVQTSELESKLGTPTATTGSGMPAYHGEGGEKAKMRKEFSSIKDVPSGYVFVPNGQNMDIVRNAVGQEQYTTKLKESGGYPSSTEQAYQQSREINKAAGRPPRAEAIAKGLPVGETVKGITKAVAGSKAVRVAGVTGALVLATDLASAAEEGVSAAKQGDTQMARGYATDILGALTGPFGMIGSQIFGTSPEDLRVLRAAEQGRKVGGGRGIAPPAAYLR